METQVKLQFEKFDSFISEVSANVSLGGMFIRTDTPVPVGSMLGFELMLADDFKLIQGRGEVVWVRTIEEGPDRPPGMGIRFRELDTASRELIYKIVYHRMKEGQKPFDLAGGARKGIGGVPAGIAAPVARAGEETPTPAASGVVVARVTAPASSPAAGGSPPAPVGASLVTAPPAAPPPAAPPRPPGAPVPARAPLAAIRLTAERPILNLPLAAAEPPPAPAPRSRQAGLEGVDPRSPGASPARPAARSASPPAIVPQPLPELPETPPAGEAAPPSVPPVQLAIPAPAPPPPVASAPALQPTAPQPVRPGRPAVQPPSLADDEVSFRGLRLTTEDLPERGVTEVAVVREPAAAGWPIEPSTEPEVAGDEPVADEAAADRSLAAGVGDGDVLAPLPAELDTGPQPRSYPDPPDLAAWRDVAWALVDESAGDALPAQPAVAPESAAEPLAELAASAPPFEPEPWSASEPEPPPAAPEALPLELHAEPELLPSLAAMEESSAAWTPTTDEVPTEGWGALVVAPESTPELPPPAALHAPAGDADATVALDARAWRADPPEREVLSMDTVGMAVDSTPPLAESPRVTAAMILSALESEARLEGEVAPEATARPASREESAAEAEARIASIYGVATERPRPAAGGWAVALVTLMVLAGVGYVFRAPIVGLLGLDRPGQVPPGSNLPVDEETGLPLLPNLEQAGAGADAAGSGAPADAADGTGVTEASPPSAAAPDWPAATPPAPPAGAERGAGRPVTPVGAASPPPASPPSAATVVPPPVAATPTPARPPAAGSVDAAVVAPALPAQRFRRVLAIEHRQDGGRTVVVIRGDGGFPVKSWARYRIDGEQPRELFKLYGVEQPFRVARVEVGTAQVLQVRAGNHPNELHVVLDLAGRARKVTDVAAVGATLEITVE